MFDKYTEIHWQEIIYIERRQVERTDPAPPDAHTRITAEAVAQMAEDGLVVEGGKLTDIGWSIAGRLRRWQAEGRPLTEFVLFDETVLTRTMYFGCIGRPGHFWHSNRLRHIRAPKDCPFDDYIDGKLPPPDDLSQGADALHHRDGWTAWAMWDYSVDRRGGCNCAFVAPGLWSKAAMVALAGEVFPGIMARLDAAAEAGRG